MDAPHQRLAPEHGAPEQVGRPALGAPVDGFPTEEPLTVEEARSLDGWAKTELGLPGAVLMENAGAAAARVALALGQGREGGFWVLTGAGQNGGDGWVAARHLALRGLKVRVLAARAPAELTGDALTMARAALALRIPCAVPEDPVAWSAWCEAAAAHAAVVVDGLLGTGVQGPPRGTVRDAIVAFAALRDLPAARRPRVLALDVPSGLDAGTGEVRDVALRADVTVTFAAAKVGLVSRAARDWVGRLVVASVGVPVARDPRA